MLSKKQLRNEIKKVAELLQRRGFTFDIEHYNNFETERKQLQIETQDLQNERNVQSKLIGKVKANGEDIEPLLKKVANLGEKLESAKNKLTEVQNQIDEIELTLPNIPHESVPEGASEDENVEVLNGEIQEVLILKLKIMSIWVKILDWILKVLQKFLVLDFQLLKES